MTKRTAADKAVSHILSRMQSDGRLAYLLGYGSQSFALLTKAYAQIEGVDVEQFRKEFDATLTPIKC